jgi:branched-chain amino acid transport system ATP-binding protein
MSYLAVEDLSLRFGGLRAVDHLSFTVEKGEVFAIIGPNGAGKTSVFNVITRVLGATAGRVLFDGREITRMKRHRIVECGIARTFQNIELFESASVIDNLLLGRHRFPHGNIALQLGWLPAVQRAEADSRARVEEIIDFLDLAPHRNVPVAGLPYGVRKVVELGRALATEPSLLLLDEPASGLNPEETRDLAFWIADIRAELGITVIMIEHDMALVAQAADRVLCMNAGEKLALGTAVEVRSNPDVVAAYLGA